MHATYDAFLDRLIRKYEGGYTWDKDDPGGPTNLGITCYDLAEHRHQPMNSMRAWVTAVKALKLPEAEEIYWTKYATKLRYDELPAGVDVTVLDYGVNSGDSRPIHVLRALFKLPGPAVMDDNLVRSIERAGPEWLIKAINTERLGFMHSIKHGAMWHQFGHGWGARVNDLELYALALAKQKPLPLSHPTGAPATVSPMPKATHDDPHATTKVGTGIGGALSTALAGHVAGVPMSYVVIFALGAVALGVGYYFYQKYAAAKLNTVVADLSKVVTDVKGGPTGTSQAK